VEQLQRREACDAVALEAFPVSLSTNLATKSVQAAVAAIEVYQQAELLLPRRGVRAIDVERLGIVAQSRVHVRLLRGQRAAQTRQPCRFSSPGLDCGSAAESVNGRERR
jgi:hypothetical protein